MGLDKILDKLGIYDLLAVLLVGITINIMTLLFCEYIEIHVFDFSDIDTNKVLLFLLISYFVGLFLQEIGSSIEKYFFFRNGRLLKETVEGTMSMKLFWIGLSAKDGYKYITDKEWSEIKTYVNRKLQLRSNEPTDYERIYNYCKYNFDIQKSQGRIDKDQSMSAMARSFSFYFLFCSIVFWIGCLAKGFICNIWDIKYFCIIVLCNSLFLIFLLRDIRFAKMRYSKILRLFYYQYVSKQPDQQSSIAL